MLLIGGINMNRKIDDPKFKIVIWIIVLYLSILYYYLGLVYVVFKLFIEGLL